VAGGEAPALVGKIDWQGETRATLRLEPGVKAMVEGKPVTQVEVSKPTSVSKQLRQCHHWK
jgi:hypothetical protein